MSSKLTAIAEGRKWQELKQWVLGYPLHLTGECTHIYDSQIIVLI